MSDLPQSTPHQILILCASRAHASAYRERLQVVWPGARLVTVTRLEEATSLLEQAPSDLLLTEVTLPDGDALDFMFALAGRKQGPRLLVTTEEKDLHLLASLRKLPVECVFDSANEELGDFDRALHSVNTGQTYWSTSLVAESQRQFHSANTGWRHLTPREQLVFSAIADGSDDTEAGLALGLHPASILSVRKELHTKLGIRHRGELIRRAAHYGMLKLSSAGVIRPAFAMLKAACGSGTRRPPALPPSRLEHFK
jgi:DNA-binding NarL/FixJ family response regulator